MNYTIYCNEKLVIENLQYYKECNLKMKQLLAKSGLPHERCYELYMQNINSKGGMPDKDYTLRYFKEKCTNKNGDPGEIPDKNGKTQIDSRGPV